MKNEKYDLYEISWGLKRKGEGFLFLAENSDFAKLFMANYVRDNNIEGWIELKKVDKESFYQGKLKKYYVDRIFNQKEDIRILKLKYEQASKEKETKKIIEKLFDGEEIIC